MGMRAGRRCEGQRRALLPTGKVFGRARQWGILKGNKWRGTGGTWLLPRFLGLERGGEGEGGLGRTFCVFDISRPRWVRMKYPHRDSPEHHHHSEEHHQPSHWMHQPSRYRSSRWGWTQRSPIYQVFSQCCALLVHTAHPSQHGTAPCHMQGAFAALGEVMGDDQHHRGAGGGQPCVPALLLALSVLRCASNGDSSVGRAGGQSSLPSPASLLAKSHSGSHFSLPFFSPQTCPCLCECARLRQRAGYPRGPRSHTHNPWVTGDTKEVPHCWEPGRGQEGQPGRAGSAAAASFLSH